METIQEFAGTAVRPPVTDDAGWRDTAVAAPSRATRIPVRFAPMARRLPVPIFYLFESNAARPWPRPALAVHRACTP
jgi:hypothetical protein